MNDSRSASCEVALYIVFPRQSQLRCGVIFRGVSDMELKGLILYTLSDLHSTAGDGSEAASHN